MLMQQPKTGYTAQDVVQVVMYLWLARQVGVGSATIQLAKQRGSYVTSLYQCIKE